MGTIVLIYFLFGILAAILFLMREQYRVDAMGILASVLVFLFWPFYILSLGIMRIFNGDWA